jgi:hypothetical protein
LAKTILSCKSRIATRLSESPAMDLVRDVNPGPDGVPEVAIEFRKANPRFWHISFPPEDWSAHGPESKRFELRPNAQGHGDPALVKK